MFYCVFIKYNCLLKNQKKNSRINDLIKQSKSNFKEILFIAYVAKFYFLKEKY